MDEQENTKAITDEVKDISGELQRKREEALQKKIEQRKTALIELVMRPTNYDKEKAEIKLTQWNNDYLKVIKEYMNPNFQNKTTEETTPTTKNQMIYGEIRNFMDDVNRQALWRKRRKEQIEKQREAYIAYMQQQRQALQKKETNQIEKHGPGYLSRDDKGKLQYKYDSDDDSKSSDNNNIKK